MLITQSPFCAEELDEAYKAACKKAVPVPVFNARVNLVGLRDSGKTSLLNRLMGKAFKKGVESTQGISILRIKSKFKQSEMIAEEWIEKPLEKSSFLEDFSPEAVDRINKISTKTRKMSSIPWQTFEAPTKIIKPRSSKTSTKDTLQVQTSEEENLQSSPNASWDVSNDQLGMEQDDTSPTQDQTGKVTDESTGGKEFNKNESKAGRNEEKVSNVSIFHQREQVSNEVTSLDQLSDEVNKHQTKKEETVREINQMEQTLPQMHSHEVNKDKPQERTEEETDRDISQMETKPPEQLSDDIPMHIDHDQAAEKLLEKERREGEKYYLKAEVSRKSHSEDYPVSNEEEDEEETKSERETKTQEDSVRKGILNSEKTPEETNPFSATFWDFSGQNDFIATHHLFLDAESTTLICMDITKPLDQNLETNPKLGNPSSPEETLHYWLNSLYVKTDQKLQPKIAIVLTHKDLIEDDSIETYVTDYIKGILSTVQGHPYANFITESNIHIVDNKFGCDKDFQNLRNQLLQYFSQQGSWGKQMPLRWMKLKAHMIDKTGKEGKGYMPLTSVNAKAKGYSINEKDVQAFLRIQNTIGDFVYYPDPGLRETIFTNPKWLVDKLTVLTTYYKGLQAEDLLHDKLAHVTTDSLKKIWKNMEIEFLKQVIIMLNLMIPVDGSNDWYIIPHMLPQGNVKSETDLKVEHVKIYETLHSPKSGETFQIGAFHQLMSECSKIKKWHLSSFEKYLSYTDAMFEIEKEVKLALILVKHNLLQVRMWCSRITWNLNVFQHVTLSRDIRHILSTMLEKFGFSQNDSYYGICPNTSSTDFVPCLVEVKEYQHLSANRFSYWCVKKKCNIHQKRLHNTAVPSLFMLSSGK